MAWSLKIHQKLLLFLVFPLIVFVFFIRDITKTVETIRVGGPLYEEVVQGKDLIADILPPPEYIIESYLCVWQLTEKNNPDEQARLLEQLNTLQRQFEERHKFWKESLPDSPIRTTLLTNAAEPAKLFFETVKQKLVPLVKSGNQDAVRTLVTHELSELYRNHRNAIDEVVRLTNAKNAEVENNSLVVLNSSKQRVVKYSVIVFVLTGLVFIGVWFSLYRAIRRVVKESNRITIAIGQGDLSVRGDTKRVNADFVQVIEGFNLTLEELIEPLNRAADIVHRISCGDIPQPIHEQYQGDFATLQNSLNGCITSIQLLASESIRLSKAAVGGDLSVRADATGLAGDFRHIVEGINATIEATVAPIREATTILERIAQKDLSARVNTKFRGDHDRLKVALNEAVANLDRGMQEVSELAEWITDASERIAAASNTLAQSASTQAASLEEISSTIEEMSAITIQNTASSKEAKQLSDEAVLDADTGNQAMVRMNEDIHNIKHSADQTVKIVKTIDEIAFQTNLLALNAAVEAARAGETGKGFAVVAEEVRNLSQRSAAAARNTAELLDESMQQAIEGVQTTEKAAQHFETIVTRIHRINELSSAVTNASHEQAIGVEQINQAIGQLNIVTQQYASKSDESANLSHEMHEKITGLKRMVDEFTLS